MLLIWKTTVILAAVPAEINYQGHIEDLDGPFDGSLDMTFRLFDAEANGNIFWEENHSVLVDEGIYSVILGAGTANPSYGTLEEAVFYHDTLWLEVQVAGEVEAMVPRQKITSVAFALRAGGVSESAITSAMIADDAVTGDKLADGAVTAAKVTGGFVPDLDADKLDGHDTAYFATADHDHSGTYYSQAHVDALENRIAALEAKLLNLTVVADNVNGMPGPHLMITGANLHVRSGSGSTDGTVNGLGNLVVGYNEARPADSDKSGSHNLVVGSEHNFSSYGGLVVARRNEISAPWASVSGGGFSSARGNYCSVSGGYGNDASGQDTSISGGYYNTAYGAGASISGGSYNYASGPESSVSGGSGNYATGFGASVSGGLGITVSSNHKWAAACYNCP